MADSSTEKKRTEEYGVRCVKGRWSEWTLDGNGIECETKEQTSGLSTEDLKWLLEPHIATYIPEHSARESAHGEGWVSWAVEVLDAYAKRREVSTITPGYVGVTSKVDGARLGFWRISVNGIRALQGDCQGMFPTAAAARIAAAKALYAEDPTLPPPPKAEGK